MLKEDTRKAAALDAAQRKMLLFLSEKHRGGVISVSVTDLKSAVSLQIASVNQAIEQMLKLELLDELEDRSQVCLSAAGFRVARVLISGVPESVGSSTDISVAPLPDSSQLLEFLAKLQQVALSDLPSIIQASTLSPSEADKLQHLAQEFFSHPATFELLRRALSR